MKYQTNGLGLLLFAALVISVHKENINEASYNDGGGKKFDITNACKLLLSAHRYFTLKTCPLILSLIAMFRPLQLVLVFINY